MAACVCRALRLTLAVTARCTRYGPNRGHAHGSVTRSSDHRTDQRTDQRTRGQGGHEATLSSVRSALRTDQSRCWKKQREERTGGHGRHGGHGGHVSAFCAALGFSLFSRSEDQQREEAEKKHEEMILLLKKAKLSLHKDQVSSASSFLHQALALAQQLHHLDALVYCYSMMANVAFVRGQLDQAEKLFKASLSVMLSRGTPENDNAVIETSLKLASIYAEQNRLDLADHGFRFCVETLEEKLQKESEETTEMKETQERTEEEQTLLKDTRLLLGLSLDSRARFWTQTSNLPRAEQDYRRSLKICREEQGVEHPQSVVLMSDLASVLDLRGNQTEALVLVQKAVELGRTQNHPDLQVLLNNMGTILLHTGDVEAAEKFYLEALSLAKSRGDEETVDNIKEGLKELKEERKRRREEEKEEEEREREKEEKKEET